MLMLATSTSCAARSSKLRSAPMPDLIDELRRQLESERDVAANPEGYPITLQFPPWIADQFEVYGIDIVDEFDGQTIGNRPIIAEIADV